MRGIYEALKKRGFRETYWQFVYRGQIGGLIKNPGNQLFEYHVRFFDDGTIYAEFEIGRSALLHFLTHRYYLNNYIGMKIAADLTPRERTYFADATRQYKSKLDRDWPEWTRKNKFINNSIKRKIRLFSALSDWRMLFLTMLISVAATFMRNIIVLPVIACLMILAYLVAPKRY